MKIASLFIAVVLVLVGAPVSAEQQAEQSEASKLVGAYTIVSGERDGKEIEDDKFKEATVRIAVNAITAFDKERKETYAATYTLDTSQKPWRMTMTSTIAPEKGVVANGLIKTDQDTVKLIYALPKGKAPTEFKAGEKQQMFVLKKSGK